MGELNIYKKSKNGQGLRLLTRTAVLLAAAMAVQMMHLPVIVTGSVVNGVLILAALFCGFIGAALIGCITPWMALTLGIVAPAVAPLVPVIMVANVTLVGIFYLVKKINSFAAAIAAALFKFMVFYAALKYLLQLLQIQLPAPIVTAFQVPQLITALIGSICAVIVGRYLGRVIDN